jgi:hypothetical protein
MNRKRDRYTYHIGMANCKLHHIDNLISIPQMCSNDLP